MAKVVKTVLPALAAALFAGRVASGGDAPLSGRWAKAPGSGSAMGFLLAAGDEDDEFGELLMVPEPQETPEPAPPEETPERAGRFGVRCGLLMTAAAGEGSWSPTVCAGVYYRGAHLVSKRIVYELGLDYIPVERGDGYVSSSLYLLRGEILFGNWSAEDKGTSLYVLGGADVISENGTREVTGEVESALAAGINLGVGFGSTKGVWDARVVYSLFPGSGNVKGNILVAAGVSF